MYQLLDDQQLRLLEFLTSESPDREMLPIIGDGQNVTREDPEEPPESTGIYRHRWERKGLAPNEGDRRTRDVWSKLDFPTFEDLERAWDRAGEREHRLEYYPDD